MCDKALPRCDGCPLSSCCLLARAFGAVATSPRTGRQPPILRLKADGELDVRRSSFVVTAHRPHSIMLGVAAAEGSWHPPQSYVLTFQRSTAVRSETNELVDIEDIDKHTPSGSPAFLVPTRSAGSAVRTLPTVMLRAMWSGQLVFGSIVADEPPTKAAQGGSNPVPKFESLKLRQMTPEEAMLLGLKK